MMNCGPVWAQHNLPFMGGSMAPDMMRFGGNVSSRSNFRRNYDQPDRYRPRQGFNDRYGNRQGAYNRGDRKRPGPSDRSRSPAPKRGAQGRDGSRKADQDRPKKAGASEEGPAEDEDTTGTQNDDLYDPAEPTTEDIADGAEKAEGQEEDDSGEGVEEEGAKDGDEDDQEAGGSESKDESGGTGGGEDGAQPTGKSTAKSGAKVPAKPGAKASGSKASDPKSPTKGADGKGQTGGRAADKARQEGMRKGGQKDKGWCTVCEVHFDGSFLDHRRTEEHKVKRDEKYPKCHPCSMGFNNRKQYEQHCSGDFHRKNVEILDNEVDETAGPLGEEYLEEIPAYFCTLCKLLLKIELKSHHCCTQGHYRRHRDIKRKEEAALKAKLAKEKAEDEEDDTNQVAYTITDEVGSDDEARAASDATGAAEGTKGSKQDKTAEETLEASPVKEASGTTKEQPEAEQDGEQPVAQVKSEPAEAGGGQDALEEDCKEEKEALENEAAALMDESKEDNVPDTNGCKSLEEDMEEQKPAVAAAESSADPPATNADPAPTKAAAPKAPAAKVPAKNVPASKAAATAPKPAATATRAPAAKTGTAAGSAAATSAPAASATAAPAPAKKPPTAAGSAAAAGGGRGGMVGGRGRGAPKAVRARKR